jgi:hypothetical protein
MKGVSYGLNNIVFSNRLTAASINIIQLHYLKNFCTVDVTCFGGVVMVNVSPCVIAGAGGRWGKGGVKIYLNISVSLINV